jgi:hypothetical protein
LEWYYFHPSQWFKVYDAPTEYCPPKTLFNRWKLWSDMGAFARIMIGLVEQDADNKTISIYATYLKAHRKASSCL